MDIDDESLFRLFTSSSEEDVISFYDRFSDATHLISFLSGVRRDPGKIDARIVDKNLPTIVCPTLSSESERAESIMEAFRNMNIVFVQSGAENIHFNYSTNCNLGIEYALRKTASPWIIITNDDVRVIDPPDRFLQELKEKDPSIYDVLYAGFPSTYHSYTSILLEKNSLYRAFAGKIIGHISKSNFLLNKFSVKYIPVWNGNTDLAGRLSHSLFSRKIGQVINFGSFGIFSRNFVENTGQPFFDPAYWNGVEDIDLSLRIAIKRAKGGVLRFRLEDEIGGSLGRGMVRYLRNIANYAVLNMKFPSKQISGLDQILEDR